MIEWEYVYNLVGGFRIPFNLSTYIWFNDMVKYLIGILLKAS